MCAHALWFPPHNYELALDGNDSEIPTSTLSPPHAVLDAGPHCSMYS